MPYHLPLHGTAWCWTTFAFCLYCWQLYSGPFYTFSYRGWLFYILGMAILHSGERNHPGRYTQGLGTNLISTAISLIISSLHQWEPLFFSIFCIIWTRSIWNQYLDGFPEQDTTDAFPINNKHYFRGTWCEQKEWLMRSVRGRGYYSFQWSKGATGQNSNCLLTQTKNSNWLQQLWQCPSVGDFFYLTNVLLCEWKKTD